MLSNKNFYSDKEILITGGTGSLGKTITKMLINYCKPKGIRIFSRDELKQWQMRNSIYSNIPISYLLGDVRDLERITRAMRKVDIVIHTAAQKHIQSSEENPLEAVKTNIVGSQNIVLAALETKPEKVMLISTDKANQPTNLYGATKMVAEKVFIHSNIYSKGINPAFSCCRYGNVLGSRGSVIPLFRQQIEETGKITITDKKMTRFWITLEKVAKFILNRIPQMHGAEIYIKKMISSNICSIAQAINPNIKMEVIGMREGEKLHEILINSLEAPYTVEFKDYYIITRNKQANPISFGNIDNSYNSLLNKEFLDVDQLKEYIITEGFINNI